VCGGVELRACDRYCWACLWSISFVTSVRNMSSLEMLAKDMTDAIGEMTFLADNNIVRRRNVLMQRPTLVGDVVCGRLISYFFFVVAPVFMADPAEQSTPHHGQACGRPEGFCGPRGAASDSPAGAAPRECVVRGGVSGVAE